MIVVSDTTPIITLLKINQLDSLHKLFGIIHIPTAVYNELVSNPRFLEILQSGGRHIGTQYLKMLRDMIGNK